MASGSDAVIIDLTKRISLLSVPVMCLHVMAEKSLESFFGYDLFGAETLATGSLLQFHPVL
jgi:hypothetical protein